MNSGNAHGGKREGAGRKPTGRKQALFWLTDEEKIKVKEYINYLRNKESE